MCIDILLACMSDLGITDSCKLPCGCWELKPGPLEEQSVFLTTEPSSSPDFWFVETGFLCVTALAVPEIVL